MVPKARIAASPLIVQSYSPGGAHVLLHLINGFLDSPDLHQPYLDQNSLLFAELTIVSEKQTHRHITIHIFLAVLGVYAVHIEQAH